MTKPPGRSQTWGAWSRGPPTSGKQAAGSDAAVNRKQAARIKRLENELRDVAKLRGLLQRHDNLLALVHVENAIRELKR